MTESKIRAGEIIKFLRQRDYELIKELGQGACGQTVLLRDEQIDEYLVCKKYLPYSESQREQLFANFVREIKLLHQIHHPNVVRVFNHYLYPDHFAGYILMEYVDGTPIDVFLAGSPESANDLFRQSIDGFTYLERAGILHRDIRPGNVLVRADGTLKIIDLGFGKRVETSGDFDKSISLNLWCQPPEEFKISRYDFATEVYFVGKLFEKIIQDHGIGDFKYTSALRAMCVLDPAGRIQRFSEVEQSVLADQFSEIGFGDEELAAYRNFADAVWKQVTKIKTGTTYITDVGRVLAQLSESYRAMMLEQNVPNAGVILSKLLVGSYYYKRTGMPVRVVKNFIQLLKGATDEKGRIILANLHTKLDAIPRYDDDPDEDEDVPF